MIAIVTGASSGIGYEVCSQLRDRGYTVYGLSRRGTAPEGVTGRSVDVTDEGAVRACIDEIAAAEGRIDLLVANAGMGISGPIEMTDASDAQYLMNVNFFGQFYAAKAVLPHMRAQAAAAKNGSAQAAAGTGAAASRPGTIVFTSSVAAPIAIPYQSFYSASKSAVNSLAMALRNEVRDYGIKISVVMPGDSGTGFTDARRKQDGGDARRHGCDQQFIVFFHGGNSKIDKRKSVFETIIYPAADFLQARFAAKQTIRLRKR